MGVTYKLTDEVVGFIISQRQENPFFSCRQLAELASEKFSLHLSKSSVHDVLKESGIITPRGRKPGNKFEIPPEKKQQIQNSLSQIKIALPSASTSADLGLVRFPIKTEHKFSLEIPNEKQDNSLPDKIRQVSEVYPRAGEIFLKAAFWDLGCYSGSIKDQDWDYYLTYAKGIRINLENGKNLFIDFPVPIERCIRETADRLINNVRPLIIPKIPDEGLFKSCMEGQAGFKIASISIMDEFDHILFSFCHIVELKREFICNSTYFVESDKIDNVERVKDLFFSPDLNITNINSIIGLAGFTEMDKDNMIVNLIISETYDHKIILHEAAEKLNRMYLCDEQNRLVELKIKMT